MKRRRLYFEPLEERLALDSQGALVGVDPHLTLSFADDAVAIAGQANSLSASFDAVVPTSVWREQILRAFQTWAVNTNADIGVVTDGGQPFGSPGASQRDDRFGDIRVGAIAMSPEVGAVSVPVINVVSGTWLGDVVFNSQFNYQTADDILAVAIHEAGNVFGLEDSSDPNSPLFTGGQPVVNPPTAADIAALQALHGVRVPDSNEVHENDNGQFADNDSLLQATELKLVQPAGGDEGFAPTILYGDVGTVGDIDYFSITTPGDYSGPITFNLRTVGISLLQPEMTVFNASGQQLSQASSQVVGGANLTIEIPFTTPHEVLDVRITGAAPGIFGIGGYSLVTTFDGINIVDQAVVDAIAGGAYRNFSQEELAKFFDADKNEFFNNDGHTDDEAGLSVALNTSAGFVEGTRYEVTGSIVDATDVDFYTVKSPQVGGTPLGVMTIAVRSLDAGGLTPTILVLDENQNALPTEIVVNGGGELIVQVANVDADTDYIVGIQAADPGGPFDVGNYNLVVNFTDIPVMLQSLAQDAVGGTATGKVHTIYIGRTQIFHFVLDVDAASTTSPTAVVVTIKDENSNAVATFASPPGERRSPPAVLLEPGTFTLEVIALALDGSLPPILDYNLLGVSISDPFVGDPEDPNSHPFACMDPDLAGFFCYPGDFVSPDPFLWSDFVDSLPAPPPLDLTPLIDLLLGDWWSWVWAQTGVNGPPLAQDDTFTMPQAGAGGAAVSSELSPTSNVLTNDIEPEGDAIVAVLSSTTLHGSLSLHPDGGFDYTPELGFAGTDRFTYVAHDFTQESNLATVRIVVGSGLAGDYDANGIVNNDDFDAWRANFGSVDELLADGNRNGIVDAGDYTVWRDNLGATAGGGASLSVVSDSPIVPTEASYYADTAAALDFLPQVGGAQAVALWSSVSSLSLGPTAQQKASRAELLIRNRHGESTKFVDSLLLSINARAVTRTAIPARPAAETRRAELVDALFEDWPLNALRPWQSNAVDLSGALTQWRS